MECDLKMESIIEYTHYITFQLIRRQALKDPFLFDILLDILPSILSFVLEFVSIGTVELFWLATFDLLLFLLPFFELISVAASKGFYLFI